MRRIKSILLILVALSLIINTTSISSAFNFTKNNKLYVSHEDILVRLENLYEQYGVGFEYLGTLSDSQYTEEEVSNELAILEESFRNLTTVTYSEDIIETNNSGSRALYDRTYTTYANVSNGLTGNATIELQCDATIHDGTISFVRIENIRTRQYGNATGFVSWTQIASEYTYQDGSKKADVNATGTLVTQLTILGIVQRQTFDHVIGMIIQAI